MKCVLNYKICVCFSFVGQFRFPITQWYSIQSDNNCDKICYSGSYWKYFFLVRMFLTLAEKILLFVPASRALNRNEGNELLNNWLSRLCHSFHRTPFQTSSKQSPASFIAIVFV